MVSTDADELGAVGREPARGAFQGVDGLVDVVGVQGDVTGVRDLHGSERGDIDGRVVGAQQPTGLTDGRRTEPGTRTVGHTAVEAELILVLSGAFIGYLPEHYAEHWVDRGRLRAILPTSFGYQAPFSLIYRRGRAREQMVLTFREYVRTSMGS